MTTESSTLSQAQEINNLRTASDEQLSAQLDTFFKTVLEYSHRESGFGSYYSQFHKSLSRIDRYGIRSITQNNEHSGLTFITRPRLNLQTTNIRQNRLLSLLDTTDNMSVQFMIRALLDTRGSRASSNMESNWHAAAVSSPLIDNLSPFITPLTNCLENVSGFPSQTLETYTTEGGFFSEDLTFAVGSDRNRKSFDLQLSIVDIQGGICNALIQMWIEYITALNTGEMIQYYDDITSQRLGYTCSLYRFLLDPSKKYITRWCKCTGGFPIFRPSGAAFDVNHGETFVEAAKKFSITFKFNHMGIDCDPIILREFNMLVSRYCSSIDTAPKTTNTPDSNYTGLPYINFTKYGPELEFRQVYNEDISTLTNELTNQASALEQAQKTLSDQINQINTTSSDVTYI